jgi:hypothetical protein
MLSAAGPIDVPDAPLTAIAALAARQAAVATGAQPFTSIRGAA